LAIHGVVELTEELIEMAAIYQDASLGSLLVNKRDAIASQRLF